MHSASLYIGAGKMVYASTSGEQVEQVGVSRYRWNGDDYLAASHPVTDPRVGPLARLRILADFAPILRLRRFGANRVVGPAVVVVPGYGSSCRSAVSMSAAGTFSVMGSSSRSGWIARWIPSSASAWTASGS
jgi:hypothetical protein